MRQLTLDSKLDLGPTPPNWLALSVGAARPRRHRGGGCRRCRLAPVTMVARGGAAPARPNAAKHSKQRRFLDIRPALRKNSKQTSLPHRSRFEFKPKGCKSWPQGSKGGGKGKDGPLPKNLTVRGLKAEVSDCIAAMKKINLKEQKADTPLFDERLRCGIPSWLRRVRRKLENRDQCLACSPQAPDSLNVARHLCCFPVLKQMCCLNCSCLKKCAFCDFEISPVTFYDNCEVPSNDPITVLT